MSAPAHTSHHSNGHVCPACADLIDDLRHEVADLKRENGAAVEQTEMADLRKTFGLSKNEAWMLLVLHHAGGRVLSNEHLLLNMPTVRIDACDRDPSQVKTVVAKVRAKVGDDTIETAWGSGYRITDAGRAKVAEALL